MKWSITAPVVVIAPHLIHPARNGADISLERVARYLSLQATLVDLIGCDTVRRYEKGVLTRDTPFRNQLRSKRLSGLATILKRSHYLRERFNTPAIARVVARVIGSENYGTVLASYLTTLSLLPPPQKGQRFLVWTHNDEFKWFADLADRAGSPLGRAVARLSLNWLRREVPRLAPQAVFLHVTENDRLGFEQVVPGHRNLVIPIGTDIDADPTWPESRTGDPVILTFTGGLAMQMATDALQHFRTHFEPALRAAFGSRLRIRVVGSQPSAGVAKLLAQTDWRLHADVTDEELSRLLRESTFTILPFPYATGVKLKLVRSLGSGIPFLSTLASRFDRLTPPGTCCCADDPSRWVAAIEAWIALPDKPAERRELLELANQYSWLATARELSAGLGRME